MIVGIDAKRIVRNGTGLGSYGRTLVNDLIRLGDSDMQLRLYAPDEGREDLRSQIIEGAEFCYPKGHPAALQRCARRGGARAALSVTWCAMVSPSITVCRASCLWVCARQAFVALSPFTT